MATVQLWVLPLDVPASVLAGLFAVLSPDERRRVDRCRDDDHARRIAAGRGWLRHVLGAELRVLPAHVQVVDGRKPRLAGTAGPSFNLSRSGELAVVAVSPAEVGADVEQLDGGRSLDAAPVACTAAELAALDRLPATERGEEFLRLWTAKEAYLKALGVGLAMGPDRVEVGVTCGGQAVPVRLTGEAGPLRWWVRRLCPRPGYVAAVAAEGPDWDIALRGPADLASEGVLPGQLIRG